MNGDMRKLEDALRGALSAATPEEREGRKHYVIRERMPMLFRLAASSMIQREAPAGEPDGRAVGMEEPVEQEGGVVTVLGTASSTSVDWYGTEMSEACLQTMAGQFASGVGCYPSHGGGFFGPGLGWDEEMGRTTSAELERANVAAPTNATEPGWILKVAMGLSKGEGKTDELLRRLARKQPIGLSIGGWFTEVRYICDEDGEIERIIIEQVELDHLAIVRSPANPDCMGLEVLRAAASPASDRAAPVVAVSEAAPAARSISNPGEVVTPPPIDSAVPTGEAANDRSQELDMDPVELEALFKRSITPLADRLTALEARQAAPVIAVAAEPIPVQRSARELELEALVARQQGTIENLQSMPVRTGSGHRLPLAASSNGSFAASEIDALLARCKADSPKASLDVREVVERHKAVLSVSLRGKGAAGKLLRVASEEAGDVLRDVLDAADQDGTLDDWRRALA